MIFSAIKKEPMLRIFIAASAYYYHYIKLKHNSQGVS